MKALRYFETSVHIYPLPQHNIPDDLRIQPFSREDDTRISQMNSCHIGQKKKRLSNRRESQDEAEEQMEKEEEEEDRDERQ